MKQLFINGYAYQSSWGGNPHFIAPFPGWRGSVNRGNVGAPENPDPDAQYVVPAAGTLKIFRVFLDASGDADVTATVRKNGSNTALAVTVTAGETFSEDVDDSISVSAGDLIDIRITANNSWLNSPKRMRWSLAWEGDGAGEAVTMGCLPLRSTHTQANLGTTRSYNHINAPDSASSSTCTWDTTESDKYLYCPLDGTIEAFYVYVAESVNPTTLVLSIYKNGSEETTTKVTYNSTESGVKSVTGLSIDIAPGDTLTVSGITTGSGSIDGTVAWGVLYSPDTDGESIVSGYTVADLSVTQNETEFMPLVRAEALSTSEFCEAYCGNSFSLKDFRVNLDTAPGSGETRAFKIRKNNSDANGTISITGTDTSGTDSSNTDSFKKDDLVNISLEATTASAAASRAFWSAVMYDVDFSDFRPHLAMF